MSESYCSFLTRPKLPVAMKNQRARYLEFIVGPFFRWWWALITGLATLLSYKLTPQVGWHVGAVGVLILTLLCSTLLFLATSVVYQGWHLFRGRYAELVLCSIQRSRDLGSDWVFVLSAGLDLPTGTIIDVHRRLGDLEVPFALIEIVGANSDGRYQALPQWLAPIHIRDYTAGRFSVSDTVCVRSLTSTRVQDLGTTNA